MDAYKIYKRIYKILNGETPINADCGKLCNKKCCENTDDETGMYLFPFEEVMYKGSPDWIKIEDTDFSCDNKPVLIALCSGKCNRNLRPLSCRIFPLIMHNNSIVVDSRAKAICPLARYIKIEDFDKKFYKSVKKVYNILRKFKDGKKYIAETSKLLDEYDELKKKFLY